MINKQEQAAAPAEDPRPPTWDELREGGCMVVDDKFQQLAVYPGGGGHVVIASADIDSSGGPNFTVVELDDVPKLLAALNKVRAEAAEVFAEEVAKWEECERQMAARGVAIEEASGEVGSHR